MSRKKMSFPVLSIAVIVVAVVFFFRPETGQGSEKTSGCNANGKQAVSPSLKNDPKNRSISNSRPASTSDRNSSSPSQNTEKESKSTDNAPTKKTNSASANDGSYSGEDNYRKNKLNKLLMAIFGYIPENPVAELSKLDTNQLEEITLSHLDAGGGVSIAANIGLNLGRAYDWDAFLSMFEHSTPKIGLEGLAASTIMYQGISAALSQAQGQWKHRQFERRALAILDGYVTASIGQTVSIRFLVQLRLMLEELCPSNETLVYIRKWIIESPHGDEGFETGVVTLLGEWKWPDVSSVVIEVLGTRRAGPIKGVLHAWKSNNRFRWKGARSTLEEHLAEAVMKTDSSKAATLASMYGRDLLDPRMREVAEALLARTGRPGLTAIGFWFLRFADKDLADSRWQEWFASEDMYKVEVACGMATSFPHLADNPTVLSKLYDLAIQPSNPGGLEADAVVSLHEMDSDRNRSFAVIREWLSKRRLSVPALHAARKITASSPKPEAKSLLMEAIDDPSSPADNRFSAMFLLAVLDTEAALAICEDQNYSGKLSDETVHLVAATAERMLSTHRKRAQALRGSLGTPEPAWIRGVRLQLEKPEQEHVESLLIGWALNDILFDK